MTQHIALLRAINVGPTTQVSMADLKDLLERLGFGEVRTWLRTGNLIFDAEGKADRALETLLEAEAEQALGLKTEFFVRDVKAWTAMIAANPYPEMAKSAPNHLLLMTLRDEVGAAAVEALRGAIKGRETVQAQGRAAYVTYPDGIGRSALTLKLVEAKLGTKVTGRNWNTVLKLESLAGG
jgi:uncharacterized protein (DUF1697 family)